MSSFIQNLRSDEIRFMVYPKPPKALLLKLRKISSYLMIRFTKQGGCETACIDTLRTARQHNLLYRRKDNLLSHIVYL